MGGSEDKKKDIFELLNKVVTAKEGGGLGLGSLRAFNLALIVKWWWRLRLDRKVLWSKFITGIHGLSSKPTHILSNKTITGVWNNIECVGDELNE